MKRWDEALQGDADDLFLSSAASLREDVIVLLRRNVAAAAKS